MTNTTNSSGAFEFVEAANQLLSRSGYELRVNPFLTQFAKAAKNFHGKKIVNPEFDPSLVSLDPSNSFWLELNRGETVASFAMRDLGSEELCEALTSYAIWGGGEKSIQPQNTDMLPQGRVTLEGACWIHPAHRGVGLAWLLPRIARALAMQRSWAPDSFMGYLVNRPLKDGKELAIEKYGCARMFCFTDSFYYPMLPVQPLYISVSDQNYVHEQLSVSTGCLRDYADQKMGRDFVAFIREGQEKPVEAGRLTVSSMFNTLVGGAGKIGGSGPINNDGFAEKRLVKVDG